MDNSPQPPLGKKDVLDAIDYEIEHRESALSRHGLSTWGVIAAIVALLWTTTNETLSPGHNWTNVLLVFITSSWILGFFSSPWFKALGLGIPKVLPKMTAKELILRFGLNEGWVSHQVAHVVLMLVVAIYLWAQGFILVGVTTCAFWGGVLLLLGICWLVFKIQIPMRLPQLQPDSRRQLRTAILVRVLILTFALVPFEALWSVWPVSVPDVRLGLMLAALTSLWASSTTFLQAPTTSTNLRDLRSQLGFGDIGIEEAKEKAKHILGRSPEEYYLTAKADAVATELRESKRLYDFLCDQMDKIIQLAERLPRASSNQTLLNEIAFEYRTLTKNMIGPEMRKLDKCMKAASSLQRELRIRVEAAKLLLNIKTETINAVLSGVDDLRREAESARLKFAGSVEQYKQAGNLLQVAQKDIPGLRRLTLSELIIALFGE
jgi:hypothetical protein